MKRKLIAAIGVAAMAASVAACGTGDDGGSSNGGGGGSDDAITVWLMTGSAPEAWLDELNAAFEEEHGVEVNVELQEWNGIQERVTTALSEDGTVDVLELGNTQTPAFAATTGLADLTDLKGDLGYDDWFQGPIATAELDGQLYAAPWYTANRAVIYDKDVWEEAGAEVPTTREEFVEALQLIEDNTDAEPIYLPGQSYYVLGGFLWDEGGDFALEDGDGWVGGLNTPEGEAAMAYYQELQSFSDSPTDNDEASPQQATEVIPQSEIATWIGLPWEADGAIEALTEAGRDANLGYFPIPGKTADAPGSVFLGGSNLAVAERGGNKDMGVEWLKMATSAEWMTKFAEATPMLPNQEAALPEAEEGSFVEVMGQAADHGNFPPLVTGWANVEVLPNPIKEMMTAVLNGEDHADAAETADAEITDRINRD
ncbi:extracellular solute-binding protein [Streptomyces lonarensis]|uniref:Extracellular solute-binding protein n=1 Tax=Streptomyces lonarensis TaxID=700599 RepID=A0A7X6CZ49_9ACTN|nr:extracellular solute-binding protein [Streptomyces lonarensis]NJQ05180.1 extracellular solute-binding protein [Streptomyces lonarensis]